MFVLSRFSHGIRTQQFSREKKRSWQLRHLAELAVDILTTPPELRRTTVPRYLDPAKPFLDSYSRNTLFL